MEGCSPAAIEDRCRWWIQTHHRRTSLLPSSHATLHPAHPAPAQQQKGVTCSANLTETQTQQHMVEPAHNRIAEFPVLQPVSLTTFCFKNGSFHGIVCSPYSVMSAKYGDGYQVGIAKHTSILSRNSCSQPFAGSSSFCCSISSLSLASR